MISPFLLTTLVLTAAPPPNQPHPAAAPAPVSFEDRQLKVTDDTGLLEVHLPPPPLTTTLSFSVDIAADQVLLVDPAQRVHPPIALGNSLVLAPKQLLPRGTSIPLTVTLADGTQLNFALLATEPYDRFLKVDVQLQQRSGADSAARLKGQLQEAQGRLDDCLQSAGDDGARKVAALILRQDFSRPDVFTVERHRNRGAIDKQSQLLVETQYVFRLFDLAYLALTVENRNPTRAWVLERAELQLTGGGATTDVRVLGLSQETDAIAAGDVGKLVLAFKLPPHESRETFTLKLLEKNGSRHVELGGLKL